jgi:uncharacterized protein YkwD
VLSRARAASALAAFVVVTGASVSASAAPLVRNVVTTMPALGARIAAGINAARARAGLVRLRPSAALGASASAHSIDMVTHGYFSHDSADGTSAWARLRRFYSAEGYRSWSAGETILWYSPGVTAAGAVREWLGDASHRAILLAPGFRELGVSAVHATSAAPLSTTPTAS